MIALTTTSDSGSTHGPDAQMGLVDAKVNICGNVSCIWSARGIEYDAQITTALLRVDLESLRTLASLHLLELEASALRCTGQLSSANPWFPSHDLLGVDKSCCKTLLMVPAIAETMLKIQTI